QLEAVHGREDLDVKERVEAEADGDAPADEGQDAVGDGGGAVRLDEVEVAGPAGGRGGGQLALLDGVGGADDPALAGLAEDLGEADHGDGAGGDEVGEHGAGPDGGELIDVADEHQAGVPRQGADELVGQRHVEHGGLVHD